MLTLAGGNRPQTRKIVEPVEAPELEEWPSGANGTVEKGI
jgi:hypothetical protein